ncbi:MAG TPA: Fe-S oxidoreductase [Chromatiales bacterium]|jgi:Fe-S oxidoreductase|nr:Fe-S oxidoreductase [Chromatiales bacterium]
MGDDSIAVKEGGLEAPTRHPIDWQNPNFYNEDALFGELERVYDICHGCRRCVNLCNAFPTLFDLVDESPTMEVDGVDKKNYWKVVDECFMCDLCYLTKCPYVPPHEWNLDFPHLMLRAKAIKFRKGDVKLRDKILTNTDAVGKLAGIPIVVNLVNATNRSKPMRELLNNVMGIHPQAKLPNYHSNTLRKRLGKRGMAKLTPVTNARTSGKVALFTTCYGNYNEPAIGEDLVAVFEHNGIPITIAEREQCCGMPKLELGDLKAVEAAKNANIPVLARLVDEGWDIITPVPSCALMFRQELPLMFPDDPDVSKVQQAIFDPFEYLMLRHKDGLLKTDFSQSLGNVSYHVACHQRVQRIGLRTRDALELVPNTTVDVIERCSGHDGTYAVKTECHEASMKIVRPVANRIKQKEVDCFGSDCAIAGHHIGNALDGREPEHPISMLRRAYGI